MPTVRGIAREAARNNYRFSSLLLGIVKSVPFQMKIKKAQELESQTVAAAGSGRAGLTSAQAEANINNR
jgi:hypothetical protein